MTVPGAVYTIWWILLLITLAVIVPTVVLLLHRTLEAARYTERYLADMLAAGRGIAEHTRHVQALEETIQIAEQMLQVAGNLQDHSRTLAVILGQRANGAGYEQGEAS